ncbi:MAG: 6-phosphogluconolactonase [Candidatus Methylomirabilales bacterium]
MLKPAVVLSESPSSAADAAAVRVADVLRRAIDRRGHAAIALSGGKTPRETYARLAQPPHVHAVAWGQVEVFWGDERCVPPDHAQSNYRMALEAWLFDAPIPKRNIHRMRGEADPKAAAREYEETLRVALQVPARETPRLDLVLLGIGLDGHTASLFPGSPALTEDNRLVVATFVQKVNGWRLTATPRLLNAARHVIFLVTGAEKAAIVREVLRGPVAPERLPAQIVQPGDGRVEWLLDRDAGKLLSNAECGMRDAE